MRRGRHRQRRGRQHGTILPCTQQCDRQRKRRYGAAPAPTQAASTRPALLGQHPRRAPAWLAPWRPPAVPPAAWPAAAWIHRSSLDRCCRCHQTAITQGERLSFRQAYNCSRRRRRLPPLAALTACNRPARSPALWPRQGRILAGLQPAGTPVSRRARPTSAGSQPSRRAMSTTLWLQCRLQSSAPEHRERRPCVFLPPHAVCWPSSSLRAVHQSLVGTAHRLPCLVR